MGLKMSGMVMVRGSEYMAIVRNCRTGSPCCVKQTKDGNWYTVAFPDDEKLKLYAITIDRVSPKHAKLYGIYDDGSLSPWNAPWPEQEGGE